jgi:hypothetical protein
MARKPYAYFYGGYMNPAVLKAAGVSPEACKAGHVDGLALTVGPIANLEEKAGNRSYGLLARVSHADLDRLYGGDAAHLKGLVYLPEAVLVHTEDGRAVPALTYICPSLSGAAPDSAYVATLVEAAERLGLPAEYIEFIRSFAP